VLTESKTERQTGQIFFYFCGGRNEHILRKGLTDSFVCRFASEVPAVAAAHIDAEVTSVAGADQQVATSTAADRGQAGEDSMAGNVAAADLVKDERPVDEGKEPVDASATRNQRELPFCGAAYSSAQPGDSNCTNWVGGWMTLIYKRPEFQTVHAKSMCWEVDAYHFYQFLILFLKKCKK